jgi:hypothetical protein
LEYLRLEWRVTVVVYDNYDDILAAYGRKVNGGWGDVIPLLFSPVHAYGAGLSKREKIHNGGCREGKIILISSPFLKRNYNHPTRSPRRPYGLPRDDHSDSFWKNGGESKKQLRNI